MYSKNETKCVSRRIGSLVIDVEIIFGSAFNETLDSLETVFHDAINNSLLGVVARVELTGRGNFALQHVLHFVIGCIRQPT